MESNPRMARVTEAGGTTVTVHTLAEAMSAPSGPPNVVVLERDYQEDNEKKVPSASEDLWISSVDGRYSSPPVPIRVGPLNNIQTFYAEWFRKALCGEFREAEEQVIDLPEEDPAIFHFLVAFLYEGRFEPIRPAASALEPRIDKGKGVEVAPEAAEASDSVQGRGGDIVADGVCNLDKPPRTGARRSNPVFIDLGAVALDASLDGISPCAGTAVLVVFLVTMEGIESKLLGDIRPQRPTDQFMPARRLYKTIPCVYRARTCGHGFWLTSSTLTSTYAPTASSWTTFARP
ncbi:uncharacterized protein NECHADRAFT_100078 [Fusarium vanettenii 77-13-4]|uniref:BTB domain-containing protein n=1 Tax=Fusarium vanettenii (strain ATCC MYA-4622 / CBS 123669 / FGSC 9596 / NRRL 45880 / 77-13-4) TaxID=660122 RepID=C7YQD2_FUSV7|nr:uncharacterized protein NECHADRAFT_100078 [Fusarium vanettenii 77-13-4]EEU46005.1 hypothetical protein NECHADRAFT_100078 [Fusarium vanettenii 77-13-4]